MSQRTTNIYETVYILKSGLPENDAAAIHQKVDNVIAKFEGKLRYRDDWGLTQLAYPIEKETMGRYTVIGYNGKSGVVEEIERHFKIIDDVIRFITVQVPADYDYQKIKRQINTAEEELRKNREAKELRKRVQQHPAQ